MPAFIFISLASFIAISITDFLSGVIYSCREMKIRDENVSAPELISKRINCLKYAEMSPLPAVTHINVEKFKIVVITPGDEV